MGDILDRSGEKQVVGEWEEAQQYMLRGMETGIEYQETLPKESHAQSHIILFADNTASVSSITAAKPGSSQSISQMFLEITWTFHNNNSKASTEIS